MFIVHEDCKTGYLFCYFVLLFFPKISLREIRRFQKGTEVLIRKLPFAQYL